MDIHLIIYWSCLSVYYKGNERVKFSLCPKILIIQLGRFKYDSSIQSSSKINQSIKNELKIKIKNDDSTIIHRYELCQLIEHCGESINNGHFISYIKVKIIILWYIIYLF